MRNSALTIRNSTFRTLTLSDQRNDSNSFSAPRPSLLVPPNDLNHFNDKTTLSRLSSSDSSNDAERPICPPSPRQSSADVKMILYDAVCSMWYIMKAILYSLFTHRQTLMLARTENSLEKIKMSTCRKNVLYFIL